MKRFIPKCKHCGKASWARIHIGRFFGHHEFEFAPPVERPKRLTIDILDWHQWHSGSEHPDHRPNKLPWYSQVKLDGYVVGMYQVHKTEPEARAAAEAYVADLLAHFRSGGA